VLPERRDSSKNILDEFRHPKNSLLTEWSYRIVLHAEVFIFIEGAGNAFNVVYNGIASFAAP
jgi:hypothetical protein